MRILIESLPPGHNVVAHFWDSTWPPVHVPPFSACLSTILLRSCKEPPQVTAQGAHDDQEPQVQLASHEKSLKVIGKSARICLIMRMKMFLLRSASDFYFPC